MEDKKAEDILLLDIHEIASFADYFIICTGTSDRMLESLADAILETAAKRYDLNGKLQGLASSGWLVIDLGDIVVHLFSPDQRDYYRLEQLWDKGKVIVRLQ